MRFNDLTFIVWLSTMLAYFFVSIYLLAGAAGYRIWGKILAVVNLFAVAVAIGALLVRLWFWNGIF